MAHMGSWELGKSFPTVGRFQAMDTDASKSVSKAEFLRVFGADAAAKTPSATRALLRAREVHPPRASVGPPPPHPMLWAGVCADPSGRCAQAPRTRTGW